jgi:hypothetical protein
VKPIRSKAAAGGAALLASAALAVSLVPGSAQATGDTAARHGGSTTTRAHLDPLNNSGAKGQAQVRTMHRRLHIDVHARGVVKGMPHAQHIHWGQTARNECPTVAKDDTNGDFRLETLEGVPAYGPVAVSLTKRGGTAPASGLAVDRFPTAPKGTIDYDRKTRTSKAVARAIRRGDAVVVVHGVDYNGNGMYDFDSAGASDLDPSLPAEATDPAICGVLRTHKH